MLGANPEAVFFDTTVERFIITARLLINVPKPSYFDSINVDRTIEIYKERLNISGMHFVFTGSFKQEDIIPLIETYIASLPAVAKSLITQIKN